MDVLKELDILIYDKKEARFYAGEDNNKEEIKRLDRDIEMLEHIKKVFETMKNHYEFKVLYFDLYRIEFTFSCGNDNSRHKKNREDCRLIKEAFEGEKDE